MQTAAHASLDQVLLVISLCAYTVAAIALFIYLFSREEWLKHLAIPLTIAGCVAQFIQLGARFELTGVWPLLNLYGSLSLFAAMSVAIFVVFAFKYKLWFAGGFVLAIAAIAVAYGVTWNEGTMPAVPSLQSYWAKIHVPLVVTSYAAFLLSFVISGLYLVKSYFEQSLGRRSTAMIPATVGAGEGSMHLSAPYSGVNIRSVRADTPNIAAAAEQGSTLALWLNTLPGLAQLDVLIYRSVAVGLPLLTLGIITGAMWAHEAWGAYWQWDPKETAALFSWIIYASYMHLHTRNQWRGMRSSWVSVIGFLSIVFCYLGVNIWISGLHSYKM
ncbi:MAG: c-type cytochrome biogenesis protein CcsB [Candidatus Eremiobacteraeota bacterium]|nr:c-type cytochrome biogenesis protein CcsB [Candidatus Eremiobacteraeota bacterium]